MKATTKTKATSKRPKTVAILAYDGLCTFEYGIAAEIFGLHRPEHGGYLYDITTVSAEKDALTAAGGIQVLVSGTIKDLAAAGTIVIPGWRSKDASVPDTVKSAIAEAYARGTRIVTICSGIYVVAASGILSGKRATTHWRYVEDFSSKYPQVDVCANELYVEDQNIITSAGSSAGIDACIHIVRSDYGAEIANSVARRMVMHPHRQGGQAQFIEQPIPKKDGNHRLSEMMDQVRESLSFNHTVNSMASIAGMSSRTFQRQFLAYTAVTAAQWLTQERLSQACSLLETTGLSVEEISESVGFSGAETLRYHFRRVLHLSPLGYRKQFRQKELLPAS